MNRQQRKKRISYKLKKKGDFRLVAIRSGKHMACQIIDKNNKTLMSASSRDKDFNRDLKSYGVEGARFVGQMIGKKVVQGKIELTNLVFDRNGRRYHGRVKALAEGARENLNF